MRIPTEAKRKRTLAAQLTGRNKRIFDEYEKGTPIKEMMAMFHIGYSTIYKAIREHLKAVQIHTGSQQPPVPQ